MKKYLAGFAGTSAFAYLAGCFIFQTEVGDIAWPHLLTWLSTLG